MKLRKVIIKNFRCLVDVNVPLDDLTVLVGENNSGKTSFLDALSTVLGRNAAGRDEPFDEYDYHMFEATDSPQGSKGIVIEIWFSEDQPSEWPPELIRALHELIQLDPTSDINLIGLRLTSKYSTERSEFDVNWEFLNIAGQPLVLRGRPSVFHSLLLRYIYLFYLSALRDSRDFFSPRSPFWGRILRTLQIEETQKEQIYEKLEEVNDILLKADSRLEEVRDVLEKLQKVIEPGTRRVTAVRALPMKIWDLMARSEVTIKGRGGEVDFPLSRHGQGTQSLSVFSIFQAYIDVFLKPTFEDETEALFALEEPEAHLHPQVTRALATTIQNLKGQKVISSHSPYFIQEVPLTQIRLFRRRGKQTVILFIKRNFTVEIPYDPELGNFCSKPTNLSKYTYIPHLGSLSLVGKMEHKEFMELLQIYPRQPAVHQQLKHLNKESQLYLSESDLRNLEVYVKRIRGELLFARGWLLCEGQSEYVLLRFFAKLLGKSLDDYGVSVIDFQNNGSPGAFVSLACAFEIPWMMICDGDQAGTNFITEIRNRGIEASEISQRVIALPSGEDLELFLVKNGFANECCNVVKAKGRTPPALGAPDFEILLVKELQKDKVEYAASLVQELIRCGADASRVPPNIKALIEALTQEVN